jgi:hypothetical protein
VRPQADPGSRALSGASRNHSNEGRNIWKGQDPSFFQSQRQMASLSATCEVNAFSSLTKLG